MSQSDFQELTVVVDNPQKHFDPLETYVSFRVTTKFHSENSPPEEYVVRRRYSDFVWLRSKLIETFPTLVVPALPAKHSVLEQLDRYSRSFVLTRMAMLHAHLKRLTNHPVFSCCPILRVFLTAKSTEFTMHSKANLGLFDRLTGSLQHITGFSAKGYSSSPEFKPVKTNLEHLGQKLSAIQSINCKVYKERLELQEDLDDAKRALGHWSTLERELHAEIAGIATAVEAIAISQQNNLLTDFTARLSQPVEEYLNYVDAVKEALSRRDAIQYEYENSVVELNKKRQEKEELENLDNNSVGFGFKLWKVSNRDRIARLQQELPTLDRLVEENQDKLEIANESLKSDLERWNVEKVSDIKDILQRMADHHVAFYADTLKAWETALETLKKGKPEEISSH